MTTFQKVWAGFTLLQTLFLVLGIMDGNLRAVVPALFVGYGVARLLGDPK